MPRRIVTMRRLPEITQAALRGPGPRGYVTIRGSQRFRSLPFSVNPSMATASISSAELCPPDPAG